MFSEAWTPATALELSRMVAANFQGPQSPLLPVGGRTALHYGRVSPAEMTPILTDELNRVIDYPARDMTITVEAGMRIDDLREILAAENQQLPIDVAQSHRATIGGAIASNTSGPGRYGYGTFRDYVIGISAVDGQGRLFSAGGRVVKNVAGYDFCKLLIGSLGTLGIITQVTLKLVPRPHERKIAIFSGPDVSAFDAALDQLNLSRTRPVMLDVLNAKAIRQLQGELRQNLPADADLLCVGYAGSQDEADWQTETVTAELSHCSFPTVQIVSGEQADHLWTGLTEYQAASDDPLTFQVNVPPSKTIAFLQQAGEKNIALQAHAGNGVIIGHLPDSCSGPETAADMLEPLRKFAESAGGALVILNCDDNWNAQLDVFGSQWRGKPLMQKIKQALDPANVFSPGRLW